mmetsp:Transcript_78107/g.228939  ORF Transcript_78107/g.228939 Transcript_78107/m.228939 type:complete len:289 (+) Transcript_78107:1669-2535(+)
MSGQTPRLGLEQQALALVGEELKAAHDDPLVQDAHVAGILRLHGGAREGGHLHAEHRAEGLASHRAPDLLLPLPRQRAAVRHDVETPLLLGVLIRDLLLGRVKPHLKVCLQEFKKFRMAIRLSENVHVLERRPHRQGPRTKAIEARLRRVFSKDVLVDAPVEHADVADGLRHHGGAVLLLQAQQPQLPEAARRQRAGRFPFVPLAEPPGAEAHGAGAEDSAQLPHAAVLGRHARVLVAHGAACDLHAGRAPGNDEELAALLTLLNDLLAGEEDPAQHVVAHRAEDALL